MRNRCRTCRLGLLLAIASAFAGGCASRSISHMPPTREGAPYSRAVLVGDTLYMAGDGVIDPATGGPYADPAEEAHKLMQSLQATLAVEGMSLDDMVYVTVYCTDLALYDTFNEVYASYFEEKDTMPARAFVGAGSLLWGMRFEIQAIAVKR